MPAVDAEVPETDLLPDHPKPSDDEVTAAEQELPGVLRNMGNTTEGADPGKGQRVVLYQGLAAGIQQRGHGMAAIAWAIYGLVRRGVLKAQYQWTMSPMWLDPRVRQMRGGEPLLIHDVRSCLLFSTPQLWEEEKKRTAVRPQWNSARGELSWDGSICKRFRQRARNQKTILDAFQEEGWPERIDDPLPGDSKANRRQRLADALRRLNDNTHLRFEFDGTTEGILWRPKASSSAR